MEDSISQKEFARFVADMSAGHATRGALGIGWARWTKARDARTLNASRRRRDPSRPFEVRPIPPNPEADMAVIEMLEPEDATNQRALGFDMYSENVRRRAMDEARRLGRPVASGKVHLLQDSESPETAGILIYLPVFDSRADEGDAAQPRLKGFAYTPVRVPEFIETAIAGTHRDLGRVALYDGAVSEASLLAATPGRFRDRDTIQRRIEFVGRTWTLVVTSRDRLGLTTASKLVLGFGTLVSLLFMALAWLMTSRAAEDRKVLEWLSRQSAIRIALTRELNHRVKNTLANVISIVALTRRRTSDIDEFADGLTGRVRALSATHDLLSQREWSDALVHDVVTSELAPYLDTEDPHAEISGPEALLAPNDAMSLGLALHELATNAAKYGALSVPEGRVTVTWRLPTPDRCEVVWRERGGPPVVAPTRRGFGLELIERIVSRELNAPIDLRFEPGGLVCTLTVPLRNQPQFTIRERPAT